LQPAICGHIAIMRIDHGVKQMFGPPESWRPSATAPATSRAEWWFVSAASASASVFLIYSGNCVINEVLEHRRISSTR